MVPRAAFAIAFFVIVTPFLLDGLGFLHRHERDQGLPGSLTAKTFAIRLSHLISPEYLDDLPKGLDGTSQLRKACHLLELARRQGHQPEAIIDLAQKDLAPDSVPGRLAKQKESLLDNLAMLTGMRCLHEAGMAKLRMGNAPLVRTVPHVGEAAAVDYIIPPEVIPESRDWLFNLKFLPESIVQQRKDQLTAEDWQMAQKWHQEGLLNKTKFEQVMLRYREDLARIED